jgi:glucose-1-phosphate cytidylyltransferase
MKVVLFCGGLGTRIRENFESVPKPMIPIGNGPVLLHLMKYYMQYGHRDFVLCLGYKANVIKDFFLNYRPQTFGDCVISDSGKQVDMLDDTNEDWRVALIDTGVWRSIGERLWAVRHMVEDEEMFLANYSDGLSDVDLSSMIEQFRRSNKLACFLAVRPHVSVHFADIGINGEVRSIRSVKDRNLWINGGFFILRPEIFDYMREGEELVEEPFRRLIADDKIMAIKHDGFWRGMDTLKDRQALEDLVENGKMPWLINGYRSPERSSSIYRARNGVEHGEHGDHHHDAHPHT